MEDGAAVKPGGKQAVSEGIPSPRSWLERTRVSPREVKVAVKVISSCVVRVRTREWFMKGTRRPE